jgi:hypothetical protein
MDNMACHLLETMALQGQQDPLLTMWVTSCAIRLFDEEQKVSSYKVV